MASDRRHQLLNLLRTATFEQIVAAFRDGTLERLTPGAEALDRRSQLTKDMHLEDTVSIHTALVIIHSRETPSALLKGIKYDDIDLLAALLHDYEKPSTRVVNIDGSVSFPEHDIKMANRLPYYAELLGLSQVESAKLDFMIRHHIDAHDLLKLSEDTVKLVTQSDYSPNLAVLQRADAMGSWTTPDGSGYLPVRWDLFFPSGT